MTKDFSIMIYVLTEGKMRILQVTGLQIPLTRVVSIWKTKQNKTNQTMITTVTLIKLSFFLSWKYKEIRTM